MENEYSKQITKIEELIIRAGVDFVVSDANCYMYEGIEKIFKEIMYHLTVIYNTTDTKKYRNHTIDATRLLRTAQLLIERLCYENNSDYSQGGHIDRLLPYSDGERCNLCDNLRYLGDIEVSGEPEFHWCDLIPTVNQYSKVKVFVDGKECQLYRFYTEPSEAGKNTLVIELGTV